MKPNGTRDLLREPRRRQQTERWAAKIEARRALREGFDALVAEATAAGYADAEAVVDLCAIADLPELIAPLLAERLPLEEARKRVLDALADESDSYGILSPYPELQFYPTEHTPEELSALERCSAAIQKGLETLPPQEPELISADLMRLPPCMSAEELGALGVRAPRSVPFEMDVLENLARLPVQVLRVVLCEPAAAERPDAARKIAAHLSATIFLEAGDLVGEEDVWQAARDIAVYWNRVARVAEAVDAPLEELRTNRVEGQRAVVSGVFEHAIKGPVEVPFTWRPWGLELLARSLSGEQRMKVFTAKDANNAALMRTVFLLGICDPETRAPYFQERDLAELPIVEVYELARVVLWLSGIVATPGRMPSYQSPLGEKQESPTDRTELRFLLRAVNFTTSDPDELRLREGMAAVFLWGKQRYWRTAEKSTFGCIGKGLSNEWKALKKRGILSGDSRRRQAELLKRGNAALDYLANREELPARSKQCPDLSDYGGCHPDDSHGFYETVIDTDGAYEQTRYEQVETEEYALDKLREIEDQPEPLVTVDDSLLEDEFPEEESTVRKGLRNCWLFKQPSSIRGNDFEQWIDPAIDVQRAFARVYGTVRTDPPWEIPGRTETALDRPMVAPCGPTKWLPCPQHGYAAVFDLRPGEEVIQAKFGRGAIVSADSRRVQIRFGGAVRSFRVPDVYRHLQRPPGAKRNPQDQPRPPRRNNALWARPGPPVLGANAHRVRVECDWPIWRNPARDPYRAAGHVPCSDEASRARASRDAEVFILQYLETVDRGDIPAMSGMSQKDAESGWRNIDKTRNGPRIFEWLRDCGGYSHDTRKRFPWRLKPGRKVKHLDWWTLMRLRAARKRSGWWVSVKTDAFRTITPWPLWLLNDARGKRPFRTAVTGAGWGNFPEPTPGRRMDTRLPWGVQYPHVGFRRDVPSDTGKVFVGSIVKHPQFGVGQVVYARGGDFRVRFEDGTVWRWEDVDVPVHFTCLREAAMETRRHAKRLRPIDAAKRELRAMLDHPRIFPASFWQPRIDFLADLVRGPARRCANLYPGDNTLGQRATYAALGRPLPEEWRAWHGWRLDTERLVKSGGATRGGEWGPVTGVAGIEDWCKPERGLRPGRGNGLLVTDQFLAELKTVPQTYCSGKRSNYTWNDLARGEGCYWWASVERPGGIPQPRAEKTFCAALQRAIPHDGTRTGVIRRNPDLALWELRRQRGNVPDIEFPPSLIPGRPPAADRNTKHYPCDPVWGWRYSGRGMATLATCTEKVWGEIHKVTHKLKEVTKWRLWFTGHGSVVCVPCDYVPEDAEERPLLYDGAEIFASWITHGREEIPTGAMLGHLEVVEAYRLRSGYYEYRLWGPALLAQPEPAHERQAPGPSSRRQRSTLDFGRPRTMAFRALLELCRSTLRREQRIRDLGELSNREAARMITHLRRQFRDACISRVPPAMDPWDSIYRAPGVFRRAPTRPALEFVMVTGEVGTGEPDPYLAFPRLIPRLSAEFECYSNAVNALVNKNPNGEMLIHIWNAKKKADVPQKGELLTL